MPFSEVAIATPFDVKKIVFLRSIPRNPFRRSSISTVEPLASGMTTQASVTTSYNTMMAGYPNQIFVSAIDTKMINANIMSMDPNSLSETEDILGDPAIMEALRCADRQYHEGKAILLEDLMKEMGFEEDEL